MPLFALGSNGSGQLGIGHREDVSKPTRHLFLASTERSASSELAKVEPVAIRAGGNHTLIQTANGELYISGVRHTESGSVPPDNKSEAETHEPGAILPAIYAHSTLLADHAHLFAATWEASMVITKDGTIRSFGLGDRGELGRDEGATDLQVQIPIGQITDSEAEPHKVIHLASGVQHTVAVFGDGQVWGWGNGRKGQLGEPREIVRHPRKIENLDFKVVHAVCGREFTFLVGDPTTGKCCVLGSDKWNVVSASPSTIPGWKDVGACWGCIVVLLANGRIISWGRNDHGQLAPSELPPISQIACGSEHCLALTIDNKVLAWGWGEHGNCGTEVDAEHDVKSGPTELKGPSHGLVIGIGAGCATSWFWTDT